MSLIVPDAVTFPFAMPIVGMQRLLQTIKSALFMVETDLAMGISYPLAAKGLYAVEYELVCL